MTSDLALILGAARTCGATAAVVLAHHLAHGPASQADIADALGLHRRTVLAAVRGLAESGRVETARGVIKSVHRVIKTDIRVIESVHRVIKNHTPEG